MGIDASLFREDKLRVPQPWSLLPSSVQQLVESTRSGNISNMQFISGGEYYEIEARCIAQTREDLLPGREGIRALVKEYAEGWIFPEDRAAYLSLLDMDTAEDRLRESGATHLVAYLRTAVGRGRYAWKQYILLRQQAGIYVELVRNVHGDMMRFLTERKMYSGEGEIPPEILWRDLVRSGVANLFWKDKDRRFLGASQSFLNYYGFDSEEDILGRNDEELGWHVHPNLYMNDEFRVIKEGITIRHVPGKCKKGGEDREIFASKTPLYDSHGGVIGLLG